MNIPQPIEFRVDIAGGNYYDFELASNEGRLYKGVVAKLRREPDNPHDTNAVEILLRGVPNGDIYKLGYIPKSHSGLISGLLAWGCDIDPIYSGTGYFDLTIHFPHMEGLDEEED